MTKTETVKLTLRDLFSSKDVFTVKKMTAMAVLLAVRAILGLPILTIYVGGVKVFTLAHIVDALCSMLFGPIAGLVFGFAGDFLGFVASQGSGGGYLIFYALSEMTTCFLFAIFLYKREISWTRIVIPSILNLGVVFLGLNTLWFALFYGKEAMLDALPFRAGLNCAITPAYIILIYLILSRLMRVRRLNRYLR
jgi:ECF transporter S component (folate family)